MRGAELKLPEKTAHRVQVTRGKDSARSTTSRSATCVVVAPVDSHLHRRDFIVDLESHRSPLTSDHFSRISIGAERSQSGGAGDGRVDGGVLVVKRETQTPVQTIFGRFIEIDRLGLAAFIRGIVMSSARATGSVKSLWGPAAVCEAAAKVCKSLGVRSRRGGQLEVPGFELTWPIRPTRRHAPISPHCGLYAAPSLCRPVPAWPSAMTTAKIIARSEASTRRPTSQQTLSVDFELPGQMRRPWASRPNAYALRRPVGRPS